MDKKKLTKKQAGFVRDYIDTGNATKAVWNNYDIKDDATARSIGSENLTKPNIIEKLRDAQHIATSTIISLATEAENESVRLKAAQDIMDRTEGKATIRAEIQGKIEQTINNIPSLTDDELLRLTAGSTEGTSETGTG